jgi:hypothetical protein
LSQQRDTIALSQPKEVDYMRPITKVYSITLRTTETTKETLRIQAEREHRNMSQQIEHLIMQEEARHKAEQVERK